LQNKKKSLFDRNIELKISWRDTFTSVIALAIASIICACLKSLFEGDHYPQMIFLVAVMMISRLTDGYLYGIISSFIGVILANYIFTFPYFLTFFPSTAS